MTGNRFIAIEGLDATGKSTSVNRLAKYLDFEGAGTSSMLLTL